MKNIIVNATALRSGGALSILRQFISNSVISGNDYYIFVDESVDITAPENCYLLRKNTRNWAKRIFWDFIGLRIWLYNSNVKFSLLISLQNTSVFSDLKQIVYLHQPIPFYDMDINILKNFKFFLYKHFYKFFVFCFLKKNDEFVVQSEWLKKKLHCKNVINVFYPSVDKFSDVDINCITNGQCLENELTYIFYPASPYQYKNHVFLLDVLERINDDTIVLLVTFSEGDYPQFDRILEEKKLRSNVRYLGYLNRELVFYYYYFCNFVAFPSEVETFGLPLLEAAGMGKAIVCSNLEYSNDVIGDYDGAFFVGNKDLNGWSNAFKILSKEPKKTFSNYTSSKNTWNEFFIYLDRL
ncbi:glycosyltransferase [Vibrio fluvialis]|nr:glycosyltransferase [Vibrio fluvialis]